MPAPWAREFMTLTARDVILRPASVTRLSSVFVRTPESRSVTLQATRGLPRERRSGAVVTAGPACAPGKVYHAAGSGERTGSGHPCLPRQNDRDVSSCRHVGLEVTPKAM